MYIYIYPRIQSLRALVIVPILRALVIPIPGGGVGGKGRGLCITINLWVMHSFARLLTTYNILILGR